MLEIIGACGKEATVGEYLDEKMTREINFSEKDYFRLISLKTGRLFAASAACGAIAGNGSKKEIDAMYKMGEKIGVAFQIYDDLLNMIGDEKILKKPTFSDLENGKQNLVIIHSFKNSEKKGKKFLMDAFGKKHTTTAQKEKIKKIIEEAGSIRYAEKKAQNYILKAKIYLDKINNNRSLAKEKIIRMSNFVIGRNI